MIFYEEATWAGLCMAGLPAFLSLYFFFIRQQERTALILLLSSAFLLRLLMISLDPFLHPWDEKFHALVAKNMMDFPLKPMLFANPIVIHDYKDWSYSHIWLNKQPVFLWQMALSMKVFGVNFIAMRLPSAIMSTLMVLLTYDLGKNWMGNAKTAFIAAYLWTFGYYSLSLISGELSLDHNDMAFTFYVTCGFWAFSKYIHHDFRFSWALVIGVFAGLAILNKWLTALLIYGGWGLYLLIDYSSRFDFKKYIHLATSVAMAAIVCIPWQIYIRTRFPREAAQNLVLNRQHISEDLGHPGDIFYHLLFMPTMYSYVIIIFLVIGLVALFNDKQVSKKLSIAYVSMIAAIYAFFSIVVSTKMPTYVFPVASLIFIISSFGVFIFSKWLHSRFSTNAKHLNILFVGITFILGILAMNPWTIAGYRSHANSARNIKIENTILYKKMDTDSLQGHVIFNCRAYENIDLMFLKDITAYHFYPDSNSLDSLQAHGHRFAAFDYTDHQKLPLYMAEDTAVIILKERPQ